jgi:drug/metabolite transporter (DMT)-like permease
VNLCALCELWGWFLFASPRGCGYNAPIHRSHSELLLATISLSALHARAAASQARGSTAPAYLALAAGVLCISFTAILTKWAGAPGPVAAAWRMIVATVVLAPPFIRQTRRWSPQTRKAVPWGMMGGLWFAVNLGMLNSALMLTSAANATLLDNTAPIWVGLGALILFREQLRRRYWAGLALALLGAAVVTGFNPAAGITLRPGDALAFTGALFYAGYLLNTQRGRRDLDSLSYLWLVAATAAIGLLIFCFARGLPLTGYAATSYASLIAVGLISQVGGWLLISYALGHVPASGAVVVLLAQPVVTGLLSIPLLGEALTGQQVIGGAFALAGIYLCLRSSEKAA